MEINTKRERYLIDKDSGLLLNANEEIIGELSRLKPPPIDENVAINHLRTELSDEEILNGMSSCVGLGLGITEACNFRCRYCVYSGKYPGERIHSTKKMSLDTAQRAIQLFFDVVTGKNRSNKKNDLSIGFFGGECLLEFDLIKEVIYYTGIVAAQKNLERQFDLSFRITTNGFLLDNPVIIDFLAGKNVRIDVSLDGPKAEHDKFRLTKNGKKTWYKIISNLNRIKESYPEYFKDNIKPIVTLHPHHDPYAIDRFFIENDLFNVDDVRINRVNLEGLDKRELKKLRINPALGSALQNIRARSEIENKLCLKTRDVTAKFTEACFPGGAKIFVDSDGNLNVCENIKTGAPPLGNTRDGIDFTSIRRMIRDYNEQIIQHHCWTCDHWMICDMCFAKAFQPGIGFNFNCSRRKFSTSLLQQYIEEKEEADETIHQNCFPDHDFNDFIACL